MKKKIVSAIIASVLSISMIVPAFAVETVAEEIAVETEIEEEVAIEDDGVALEEGIAEDIISEDAIEDEEVVEEIAEDEAAPEIIEEIQPEDAAVVESGISLATGSVVEDEMGTVYLDSTEGSIIAEEGNLSLPEGDAEIANEDGTPVVNVDKIDDDVLAASTTINLGSVYTAKFAYGDKSMVTGKFVLPSDGVITYISTRPVRKTTGKKYYYDEFILDSAKNCMRGVSFYYQWNTNSDGNYYITRIGLKKGTYYLALDYSASYGNVETFNFGMAFTSGSCYEKETNENIASAKVINTNTCYKGFLGDSYSVSYNGKDVSDGYDYYKVNLKAGTAYKVWVPDLEKYYNTTTISYITTEDYTDESLSYYKNDRWNSGRYAVSLNSLNYLLQDKNGSYFCYIMPSVSKTYYIKFYNYNRLQYSYRFGVYDDVTLPSPTENTYNIKFNGNGSTSGNMMDMYEIPYSASVKLTKNQYKRNGYTFKCWNTKKDGSGKSYNNGVAVKKLTSTNGKTITLYAQWTPIKYNIKFNANGGKGSMSTVKGVKYNSKKKLPGNKYTKKGYTFLGWNTNKKAKTAKYKNKAEIKNLTTSNGKTITLYAIWKKK